MIRLVILDFDGTLADTQPLIVGSLQRTIRELHLPARTDAECRSIIGLPLKECFTTLLGVDDTTAERCADHYRRVFDEDNHPGTVTLFSGVLDTITSLYERGLKLAICSSRGRPTLDGFVATFGLQRYIGAIVSANDVLHAKPHPEPVQLILKQLDIPAGETIVVGDASFDILMGRAAGCHTVGVTYGNQSAANLQSAGADKLIDCFADLIPVVESF